MALLKDFDKNLVELDLQRYFLTEYLSFFYILMYNLVKETYIILLKVLLRLKIRITKLYIRHYKN